MTMIRPATAADVPACVAMGLRFAEQEYAHALTPDAGALTQLGLYLLEHGAIFVAEKDGAVIGMIGLAIAPHIYTGRVYASELFLWVNEDQRGCGVRLIREGEAWARQHGAESIQLVSPSLRVNTLYERLGYTRIETSYQRTLTVEPRHMAAPCLTH